jgi:hypothetical protein
VVAGLFSEAVFDYEFTVKAAALQELLARAAAAAERSRASGAAPGAALLGSTLALRASAPLEAFARTLALQFHRLRLPPPPPPLRAPEVAMLTQAAVGYALPRAFAAARAVIAAAMPFSHPKSVRGLRSAANHWAATTSVLHPGVRQGANGARKGAARGAHRHLAPGDQPLHA